ncbi:DnaJ-domain-containing protein [Aspergillus heteromorphus CBS 117.55]|uniref:DnaJ-domain-containing protein n=1 Tax=Aspergillus heteromorphus CBS 117.55 TaxID=1448321 RepID=A0A317USP8_9EURO|nr:DnaJ-domain-containing protein [Aspergillus heteromorphus CBS 117.55]PWY65024.1 DnaJ-domain-containing protein [Aspergillus heteromorphus CBS 117.55]
MGQSYSTNNAHSADRPNEESHRIADYYDLLQVDQDASTEEVKKAYRKKALELHPDRNYGNAESATKRFAEIQSAYEVLSDPQERSWYNAHRDVMLGSYGGPGTPDISSNARTTTANDIYKLFPRFSPGMEFSDSPDGFYGGLSEIFSRLAMEEQIACRGTNTESIDYPPFGSRDDNFEAVVRPFYASWTGFSTRKTFAWKDVHRYSDAPDRRVRRLMEKENKRLRDEGIREFNDAVRSLVTFVRKRDPRYKSSAQSESQRQEALRQSVASQAARSRAANQAKLRDYTTQDWAKSEDFEDELFSSEGEMQHFECVVCRKVFKSVEQVVAHERSKKHVKAVKQLQKEMRNENRKLGLAGDSFKYEAEAATTFALNEDPIPTEKAKVRNPDGNFDHCTYENRISSINSPKNNYPPSDDDTDDASRDSVEGQIHPVDISINAGNATDGLTQDLSGLDLNNQPTVQKLGKAKQKRMKNPKSLETQRPEIRCATCNALFATKSQLFSHLTELDHAKPQTIPKHRKKR